MGPNGETYPEGTEVTIPGIDKPLVIGKDGTVTIPNTDLPSDKIEGSITIQEPGKLPVQGGNVTIPSKIKESRYPKDIIIKQDPKTGNVTIKPIGPNGETYPEGTIVRLPGINKKLIVGPNGEILVLNKDLPKTRIFGPISIQEPGKTVKVMKTGTTPIQLEFNGNSNKTGEKDKLPSTGVTNNLLVYGAVLIVLGLTVNFIYFKKNKNNQ